MLARAAIAAAVLVLSFAAYRLWKRPPRRLSAGMPAAMEVRAVRR